MSGRPGAVPFDRQPSSPRARPSAPPTLVVGAGVSGLACARELRRRTLPVRLFERSRGVGGRCATRRLDALGGQPVDHGLTFLHGSEPAFLDALAAVDDAAVPGWPRRVQGVGRPCQPRAFRPQEVRVAFDEGLNVFPKFLARGLEVTLDAEVTELALADGLIAVRRGDRELGRGGDVVLALAVEQSLRLLDSLANALANDGQAPPADLAVARALLGSVRSLPCLAVIAAYPTSAPLPEWEMLYPDDSAIVNLIAHDSSKRRHPAGRVLVIQALPRWSRGWIAGGGDLDQGAQALLEEAARLLGAWVAAPIFRHPQRWSAARIDQAAELSQPLVIGFAGGARLGLCGDLFAPGGGVEAAFTSGRQLAERLSDRQGPAGALGLSTQDRP